MTLLSTEIENASEIVGLVLACLLLVAFAIMAIIWFIKFYNQEKERVKLDIKLKKVKLKYYENLLNAEIDKNIFVAKDKEL